MTPVEEGTQKPAAALEGMDLPRGWHVTHRIQPRPGISGGSFSEQYLVESENGTLGFLKALDFTTALAAPDLTVALQKLTEAYNFELDLVLHCANQQMSRVVLGLDHGEANVRGYGPLSRVPYIIFERAHRDARQHVDLLSELDLAWVLRSMHHVSTGIRQLHDHGVMHQDVKPSNVLVFEDRSSKIGDLGRASRKGYVAPHDEFLIAGKKLYAPPDLLYGHTDQDAYMRRRACDLYQIGGLLFFFFVGIGATAALGNALTPGHRWTNWQGTYEQVLPYVRGAFDEVALSFHRAVPDEFREPLTVLFRELADPDPVLRGDPKASALGGSRYGLHRYISRFNALAVRAEMRFRSPQSL